MAASGAISTVSQSDTRRLAPTFAATVLALGFVVAMYLGSGVNVLAATRALVIAAGVGLGVTLVSNLLMGDRYRGGVLALLIVLLLIGLPVPLTVLLIGVIVALIVDRWRGRGRPPGPRWRLLSRVLDGTAAVLAVVMLIQAGSQGTLPRVADDLATPASPALDERREASIDGTPEPPDIYLLLLDGHLRPDRMRELFGVDASGFVAALEARGFDVATGSRANYLSTGQSLPTMLNMTHLPSLLSERQIDLRARHPGGAMREMINHSSGIERLRDAGYRIVSLSPGFEHVSLRKADQFIDTGEVNEFEYSILRVTGLGGLILAANPEFLADQHRARVQSVLQATADVATSPSTGPRFVWAHVPSPHSPTVFGLNGEHPPAPGIHDFFDDTASGSGVDPVTFGRRRAEQTQVIDSMAIRTIDDILENSDRPPVIVVLSDHGSGVGLTWTNLNGSDVDERTANLFAALTPGHPGLFGEQPTLINTLPTLLRAYAGVDQPAVPDTLYEPLNDYGDVKEIDRNRIRWP